MGRSLYSVQSAPIVENFTPEAATIKHEKTKLNYRAYVDDEGKWWQEEFLDDGSYRRQVEARYVIGSGNHTVLT